VVMPWQRRSVAGIKKQRKGRNQRRVAAAGKQFK